MFAWILRQLRRVLRFFGDIGHFILESFSHYDAIVEDVTHIVQTFNVGKANIEREIQAIREFEFNPRWSTRVINVPAVAEHLQDLKALLFDDWKERLTLIVEPIHELSLIIHQEAQPDVSDPQGAVSAMSKATVKLGHIVTMLHQIRIAFDEVMNLVDLFDRLRTEAEGLDALFLQQGNTKITVDDHYRKRQRRV